MSQMGCDFTLKHYQEILVNALEAGYIFWPFHKPPPEAHRPLIYLRHDLDVSLEEALPMAKLEADLGISSTYFFLVNSPVYNPLSPESIEILQMIHSQGHYLGLHVDAGLFPNESELEHKVKKLISFYQSFIPLVPVVAFHRPGPFVMGKEFNGFINTYSARFFKEIKYLSDSKGVWREGCPCQRLRKGTYSVLQLLVHPVWWSEGESKAKKVNDLLDKRLARFVSYLKENIQIEWD